MCLSHSQEEQAGDPSAGESRWECQWGKTEDARLKPGGFYDIHLTKIYCGRHWNAILCQFKINKEKFIVMSCATGCSDLIKTI